MNDHLLIKTLRTEAQQNNWEECVTILPKLLSYIDRKSAIELGIKQIERYLPTFERYHPNFKWPRSRIGEIRELETQDPPQQMLEASQEFHTPGTNNFVLGIEHLWYAAQTEDKQSCIKHVQNGIGHGLMARVIELAYHDRLEDWETRYRYMEVIPETGEWRYPELHDNERVSSKITLEAHKTWESAKEIRTKVWLELAEELENYLPEK